MPLPKPNEGEKHGDWIDRCMANPTMNEEYPEEAQRRAICESLWKRGKTDSAKTWYRMEQKEDVAEISIFDEIGGWGISAKDFKADLDRVRGSKKIKLLLNSPGGEIFAGMAVYNLLAGFREKIFVEVMGVAASIASVVALAGKELVMAEGSYLMIHEASGFVFGDARDMRKTAEVLEKFNAQIAGIYANNSNLSKEEAAAAMQEETWYTAEEAIANGFADRVEAYAPIEARAFNFGALNYRHVPKTLIDKKPTPSAVPAAAASPLPTIGQDVSGGKISMTIIEILAAINELPEAERAKISPEQRELIAKAFTLQLQKPEKEQELTKLKNQVPLLEDRVQVLSKEKQEISSRLSGLLAEKHAAERKALIEACLKEGKITPKNKEAWEKQFDADPAGTRKLLEAQQPVVDMSTRGSSTAGTGELAGQPLTAQQKAALLALGVSEAKIALLEKEGA